MWSNKEGEGIEFVRKRLDAKEEGDTHHENPAEAAAFLKF